MPHRVTNKSSRKNPLLRVNKPLMRRTVITQGHGVPAKVRMINYGQANKRRRIV